MLSELTIISSHPWDHQRHHDHSHEYPPGGDLPSLDSTEAFAEAAAASAAELQHPSLSIVDQPNRFYRFRYESEVAHSRVGGLLLGRGDSKSYVRVRVEGADPRRVVRLRLTVCTVGCQDKAPHPYYLHGDGCSGGYFTESKAIDDAFQGKWEVSFSRLAIICVPKKKQEFIDKGMKARLSSVPFLPDCPVAPAVPYSKRNLDSVRLAFSLNYTDTEGREFVVQTVFSDEIRGDKDKKELKLECLNPVELVANAQTDVVIYTTNPTTGYQKSYLKVIFIFKDEAEGKQIQLQCDVSEMKKHLLVVKAPTLAGFKSERLKGQVTVCYNEFESNGIDIVFKGQQQQQQQPSLDGGPRVKGQKRSAAAWY